MEKKRLEEVKERKCQVKVCQVWREMPKLVQIRAPSTNMSFKMLVTILTWIYIYIYKISKEISGDCWLLGLVLSLGSYSQPAVLGTNQLHSTCQTSKGSQSLAEVYTVDALWLLSFQNLCWFFGQQWDHFSVSLVRNKRWRGGCSVCLQFNCCN